MKLTNEISYGVSFVNEKATERKGDDHLETPRKNIHHSIMIV